MLNNTAFFPLCIQTSDADIDEEVKQIVATGQPGHENAQFFIACEQAILLESKSVQDALVDLISTYYIFDMAYPKSCSLRNLAFFSMSCLGYKTNKSHPMPFQAYA